MIADAIRFILSNLPSILTLIAFCVVLAIHKRDHTGTRQLSWLLLLAVGIDGVWAGIFHVFFQQSPRPRLAGHQALSKRK
ncbi:hypothetical protein WYI_20655 [Ochrobactrum sp. CDB2]|nr:hypothetical protein WYI_20655 [Ochrobactrum sp. CDB2]